MAKSANQLIAQTFLDLATALETGRTTKPPRILVTGLGSEYGEDNMLEGARMAAAQGVEVTYIGTARGEGLRTVEAGTEREAHEAMERLLADGEADGAVTMHYAFPIGVSTVGRVVTPGKGRPMYIATTTGTSSSNRVEGLVKNAIYGIIAAKACGVQQPTVGLLNIEGARGAETALKQLQAGGYGIRFASSQRADGGNVMRGNDLLTGACDVLVTDPLTGNILIKLLSSFTTGGGYESVGWGYGPGIGQGYGRLIMIVSRSSGAPVVANAVGYAAQLVGGNWREVAEAEFAAAQRAGLKAVLDGLQRSAAPAAAPVAAPPKEVVTEEISGIEITDLDTAVAALWQAGIYAESGMGCTGPVILVSGAKHRQAVKLLGEGGWVSPT